MDNDILDTSWVQPYIHSIFSDSQNAEKIMSDKMEYLNKPFYKYCYVCEDSKRATDTIDYNILNFENDELFFQDPVLFNDPFDCYLGFSQSGVMKDLLIQELRRKKNYTPQMRKAVNLFFGADDSTELKDIEPSILVQQIREIVPALITPEGNTQEQNYLTDIMVQLTENEHLPLFLKLIQNKLTIADKHKIIDLLFSNESYLKLTESALENPQHKDFIIKAAQHDMHIKIERNPDESFNNEGTESFQLFDFFNLVIDSLVGKENNILELTEIKKKFNEISVSTMQKSRKTISEQCKVTCLSERMDSPLMWSHYANKHYGFCLEYDFTYSYIKNYPDLQMAQIMLLPVIYSDKRPLLSKILTNPKVLLEYNKTKKVPVEFLKSIVYGLLFKSTDWSYEKEWRIIGINMARPFMKLPPARKLFLGANIEKGTKERLIEIATKKHIPVYQMFLSPDRYKFEYYKI